MTESDKIGEDASFKRSKRWISVASLFVALVLVGCKIYNYTTWHIYGKGSIQSIAAFLEELEKDKSEYSPEYQEYIEYKESNLEQLTSEVWEIALFSTVPLLLIFYLLIYQILYALLFYRFNSGRAFYTYAYLYLASIVFISLDHVMAWEGFDDESTLVNTAKLFLIASPIVHVLFAVHFDAFKTHKGLILKNGALRLLVYSFGVWFFEGLHMSLTWSVLWGY